MNIDAKKILNNFYIITGGPGSGKTSIINELQNRGYNIVNESARAIITDQIAKDGNALPWENPDKFNELIVEHSLKSYYQAYKKNNITFFDCDILEHIAYNRIEKRKNSELLLKAANILHYNNQVFVTPPWKGIFKKDQARRQTFDQAKIIHNEIMNIYEEYGYSLIEVPKTSIAQRVNFILEKIKAL